MFYKIKEKLKGGLLALERKVARLLFSKKKGVVFVTQHSVGAKETEDRNIAGSRLIAHFTRRQIETVLVNGRKAKPYQKLNAGDVVDVYVRPNDLDVGDIVAFAVAAALIFFSGGTGAAFTAGVSLAVATGVSVLTRLLTPVAGIDEFETDEARERSSIRGSENTVSKGILPVLFGQTLQTPFYGQRPYRLVGDGTPTNKYRQYFVSGYSDVNIYDEKLGETDIDDFDPNYFTVTKASASSSFIGFDNVLPVPREEQLTVDYDNGAFQISDQPFGVNDPITEVTYEAVLEFTNVDLAYWGNKNFQVTIRLFNFGTEDFRTESFLVEAGDLTLVSGTTYRATVSTTVTGSWTLFSRTIFEATTSTRVTAEEDTNELNVVTVTETATANSSTPYNETINTNAPVNFYSGTVTEVIETSPKNTTDIDFIISFPQGLYTQNSDGSNSGRSVTVDIDYKLVGAGSYSPISDADDIYVRDLDGNKQPLSSSTTTVSGSTATIYSPTDVTTANELFYRTIGIELPQGQYVVRVRSADLLAKSNRDVGTVVMSEYNFYVSGDVVSPDILPSINQIALDAIAYKSLSGELKKYNFIGKLEIPNWDGTDWNTVEETRNPASIVRYLLTDTKVNPRAEDVSFIDNDSLVAFHEYCETNNYYADGLVTEPTKIGAVVAKILDNCKAGFTLVEGKYVFVFDDPNSDPLDMFTPHNSWDFTWNPNAGKAVDALRVKYINAETYTEDELNLYYYDGDVYQTPKSGTSDVDYQFVVEESKYINNRDHLVDRYSYSLRNIQEKRNSFEFSVNLEGLNRRLFDRVLIANTCDMTGEVTGNIKEVLTDGGDIVGFKLYSQVDIPASASISIRSIDALNSTSVINVYPVTNTGFTDTVTIDPIANNGIIKGKGSISGFSSGYTWDYEGDLFEIGSGKIYEALITNIRYNDDLTATIEAREV